MIGLLWPCDAKCDGKKSNVLWDLKFTTLYISLLIYVKVFSIPQGSKAALHLSNANVDSALSPLPFKILKNICKTNGKIFCNKCYSVQNKLSNNNYNRSISSFHYFLLYRAVLSIKHAFSVYVHNNVEDRVPSKYMHIILLSIVKVVSEVQYCTVWAVIYVHGLYVLHGPT